MAHLIEQYNENDRGSFVENANTPEGLAWHGLGLRFDRPMSVAEAIEGCRADYEVAPRSVCNLTDEQKELIAEGKPVVINPCQLIEKYQAITRLGDRERTLAIMKDRYSIVQNKQAFDFIDFLTSGSLGEKATIDCAGVLGMGERMFITAKFDESIKVKGDEQMDFYAVFTNSFDGTSSVNCMITPIRVVCNNTLQMAFKNNTGKISWKHTPSIQSRLVVNEMNMEHAKQTFRLMHDYKEDFLMGCERLGNISLNEEQVDHLLKEVFLPVGKTKADLIKNNWDISGGKGEMFSTRYENIVSSAKESMFNGIGQGKDMNGLWFVNGLTTHFQNGEKARNLNDKQLTTKFDKLVGGDYTEKLNKAQELLLAVA